jgi:hypothetical protein
MNIIAEYGWQMVGYIEETVGLKQVSSIQKNFNN